VAGLTHPDVQVMTPGEVHLDIRGVGKSFGATRALHDVSVEIGPAPFTPSSARTEPEIHLEDRRRVFRRIS
jgi:hypothetical protein